MPNGAGEKFRWGDWREPLRLSTRKGWVQGRPLIRPGFAGPPSPQGEGFCTAEWCGLLRGRFKMLSSIFPLENASQIGLSIPEEIAPPPDQRQRSQKRASGSKRAIKPGVQGACPRPSFSPFLGRNGDPRPPFFRARSFPLARFGVAGRSGTVVGLVRCPCTCPDLGRFFRVGLYNPEASPWVNTDLIF